MSTVTVSQDTINVSVVEENHAVVALTTPASVILQLGPTAGPEGKDGENGVGVPVGGTTKQRLVKKSNADYDTEWVDQGVAGLDKSIQFNDAGILGADANLKWDKNTKTLRLGIEDDTPLPNNPLAMVGSVNDYLQAGVRNTNEGTAASSDYVATADNGTDEINYIDMGINSSVYDAEGDATKANDGYLLTNGGDLVIGTEATGKIIRYIVGGSADENEVFQITASGISLLPGKTISDRPEIYYGEDTPPSAVGKADGTLFFKYTT